MLIQSSGFRRLAGVLAFAASLALNVALAAWLLRPVPRTPDNNPGATRATRTDAKPGASAANTASTPAAATGSTNAQPPFRWREIESDDYRRYIANLRAVGCPEQTVRDLIAADLAQLFAPRFAAIWQRKTPQYWQKYERDEPTPSQMKALHALTDEQGAVFKELLGASFSQQGWIDLVFLQSSDESTLLFLSEDQREAAQRVLDEAGQRDKEMEVLGRGNASNEERDKLFAEKLKLLAGVLSPEEIEEFRLRHSPSADLLRYELKYFDCTADEFKRLLDAREQGGSKVATGDLLNRGPATEQVRQLFGEERAKQFEKTTDLYYQSARNGLEMTGQPVELADRAWEISREARTTAEQLAQESSRSVEERKQQLKGLRLETDRRLNELLGEKAARGVRQNLGVVLEVTEANLKP